MIGTLAKRHAFDNGSHLIVYQRPAHLAAVGGDYAQTAPARDWEMFRNERHQLPIHVGKYQGVDLDAQSVEWLADSLL